MRGVAHRPLGMEAVAFVVIPAMIHDPSPRTIGLGVALIAAGAQFGDIADWDQRIPRIPILGSILHKFFPHRGPTHSITVAWLVSMLMAHLVGAPWSIGGLAFGGWPDMASMTFWAVFAAMMTHPIADLVNTTGVAILWPAPELVMLAGKVLLLLGARGIGKTLIALGKSVERIGPTPFGIHQQSGRGEVNPKEKMVEFLAVGLLGPTILILAIGPLVIHAMPSLMAIAQQVP